MLPGLVSVSFLVYSSFSTRAIRSWFQVRLNPVGDDMNLPYTGVWRDPPIPELAHFLTQLQRCIQLPRAVSLVGQDLKLRLLAEVLVM